MKTAMDPAARFQRVASEMGAAQLGERDKHCKKNNKQNPFASL